MNTKPRRSNAAVDQYSLSGSEPGEDAVLIAKPKARRSFETRAILTLATLSLFLLPFFYGGRSETAEFVFKAAILLLTALLCVRRFVFARSNDAAGAGENAIQRALSSFSGRESLIAGLMMSFVFVVFLQTLELPLSLLEVLSPRSAEAYKLGGLSSGSLSLDVERTRETGIMVLCICLLSLGLVALPPELVSTRVKSRSSRQAHRSSSRRYSSTHRERVVHVLQSLVVITGVVLSVVAIAHWTLQASKLFGIFAPTRTLYSGTTPHWPFVNPDHLAIFLEVAIVTAGALFFRSLYISREDARRGSSEARASVITFFLQPEKFGRLVYLSAGVLLMLLCCLLTLSRAANSLALFGLAALGITYLRVMPKSHYARAAVPAKANGEKKSFFSKPMGVSESVLGGVSSESAARGGSWKLACRCGRIRLGGVCWF